jgi:inorganic pyrophosphatase
MYQEIEVDVFIEIAKNSHIKYEYDPDLKALVCDRILHTPHKYEFNYGFIPNTLSQDGDPLDVVVIMDDELVPGCYVKCKFLGVLETEDDEGVDPKIVMCPCRKVDPKYNSIKDISDLPLSTREKIQYFFSHYKDLENKHVTVGNWLDKNDAINIYLHSMNNISID